MTYQIIASKTVPEQTANQRFNRSKQLNPESKNETGKQFPGEFNQRLSIHPRAS
ncbi:hypothetical protein RB7717 [Rhodopirellula baltica SH 1]|uniref:Uncharacterized protein n=1 Tax=Rhodopirellula baltica (strain DSM 10527 / NCIMB 13988 / SH1) TaxID=243090 RepID=Q7UN90_RHOBA|nr:hypothetical protein RB7717 [Rhodopirellula baltica SH 1]